MGFTLIPPCNELKEFVNHFWWRSWTNNIFYATAATTIELTFGILPVTNGKSEFVFSSVKGQSSGFGQVAASGSFDLFGVSLYPYALPFLFDIPIADMENGLVDLDMILKKDGEMLNEKMCTSETAYSRVHFFSEYLKKRIQKIRYEDKAIIHAIQQIKLHHGNVNIDRLASECFLSQKQFERRFKEFAGFNPKLYCRIHRFENSLLDISKGKNLTQAAHHYGYFDQSHFIRDFKQFAGFAPKNFTSLATN